MKSSKKVEPMRASAGWRIGMPRVLSRRRGRFGIAGLLCLFVLLFCHGKPLWAAGQDTAAQCRVTDSATGKPIAGAHLQFALRRSDSRPGVYVTDSSGRCRIPRSGRASVPSRLWCLADGYEAKAVGWTQVAANPTSNIVLIRLKRGSRGGGLVLDEEGHPVAHAQVVVQFGRHGPNPSVFVPGEFHFEETDRNGRWRCNHLPRRLDQATLLLLHRGFAPVVFDIDKASADGKRHLSSADLRANTAVMFARGGVRIKGRVVDAAGRPVEGARILSQDYPVWTPVDGRFTLGNRRTGANEVLIEAQGFVPRVIKFEVTGATDESPWVLSRSAGLVLKVSDSRGQPVRAALVKVENWPGPVPWDWQWQTDRAGRAEWDSAPKGNVYYAISKPGFRTISGTNLVANGRLQAVVLPRVLKLTGRVIDAATSKPVDRFRVVPGRVRGGQDVWEPAHTLHEQGGSFTLVLPGEGAPHVVRIEARGYYPEISRPVKESEEQAVLVFRVHKGEGVHGTVLDGNAAPVSGASVAMVPLGKAILLGKAAFLDTGGAQLVKTDNRGGFSFGPRRGPQTLVAADSADGFAERSIQEASKPVAIVLRPWGRLEGKLLVGGRPATNELVGLARLGFHAAQLYANAFTALTDAHGRFVMSNIPAGAMMIGRLIRYRFSNAQEIQIQAGATSHIVLGGSGRTVVGRVLASEEVDWTSWNQPAFLRARLAPIKPPKFKRKRAQLAWRRNYWNSRSGVARQIRSVPYVLTLQADGHFRADNVPPGNYELEIHYHEPALKAGQPEICRGILRRSVAIPKASSGHPTRPVDLGTFKLGLKPKAD